MRAPEAAEALRALAPDVLAAAYGKILPDEVLAIPRLGSVNVHGSLLPGVHSAPRPYSANSILKEYCSF